MMKPHTLKGWVNWHQKVLSYAYQMVKKHTGHTQEQDQVRYNRQAKVAALLPGEMYVAGLKAS